MKKGKVVSIKKEWVVRAVTTIPLTEISHIMHEAFETRKKAREYIKLLKNISEWKSVKMYRTSEVEFGDGQIFISMEKAR